MTALLDFPVLDATVGGVQRLTCSIPGASGDAIAELLVDVAAHLVRLPGRVEVHDLVVTPATHARDESTLTVYYETVPTFLG